jgi:hypothetical protein
MLYTRYERVALSIPNKNVNAVLELVISVTVSFGLFGVSVLTLVLLRRLLHSAYNLKTQAPITALLNLASVFTLIYF